MERGKKMARKFKVIVNGKEYIVEVEEIKEDQKTKEKKISEREEKLKQDVKEEELEKSISESVTKVSKEKEQKTSEKIHEVKAPMAGTVLKILVKVGQRVEIGDPLIIFEAMKMENELQSEYSGIVKEILIKEGDDIETGQILMRIG